RLRGEELMAKVDGDAVVPVLQRDVSRLVAVVVGGVVDEDCNGARVIAHAPDDRLQRGNVAEVAGDEARREQPGLADPRAKRRRGGLVDVDERDVRALRAEMLDDASPDPGAAAGDEYALVGQAWVMRESPAHDPSCLFA